MVGDDSYLLQFLRSSVGNIDGLGTYSMWLEAIIILYCLRNVELPNADQVLIG